jgi:hypothetical protein
MHGLIFERHSRHGRRNGGRLRERCIYIYIYIYVCKLGSLGVRNCTYACIHIIYPPLTLPQSAPSKPCDSSIISQPWLSGLSRDYRPLPPRDHLSVGTDYILSPNAEPYSNRESICICSCVECHTRSTASRTHRRLVCELHP